MARKSPILGLWRVTAAEGVGGSAVDAGVETHLRFDPNGFGEFRLGFTRGSIDHRLVERDGMPAVEWTWVGSDENPEDKDGDVSGRGWGVLGQDGRLRGRIFIHDGNDSAFVAEAVGGVKREASSGLAASKANARQGQFLAFIFYYTKLNGRPPAEADMQRYFGATPPAVHQMVLTLEKLGMIERSPGVARSIRLLVPRAQLPDLE